MMEMNDLIIRMSQGQHMKKMLFFTLLLLSIGFANHLLLAQDTTPICALPAEQDTYEAYIQSGDAVRAVGDYFQAVNDYSCAVQINPYLPQAYANRGKIYLDFLQNYDRAIADYSQVIELEPENTVAYNNRGWAYFSLGRYEDAISNYNRAVQTDPEYARAYNNRAVANIYLRNFQQAIPDLRKALELGFEPQSWVYNNFGIALAGTGQLNEAIESLQKAVELDPNYAQPYYWLGDVYNSLQEYGTALDNFKKHVELAGDTADPRALEMIGLLEKPSEFKRLLPLLIIALILALVAFGTVQPMLRRRRARKIAQAINMQPDSVQYFEEPQQAPAAGIVDEPPASPSQKSGVNPAVFVVPVITAAFGAILYAIRTLNRTPDE